MSFTSSSDGFCKTVSGMYVVVKKLLLRRTHYVRAGRIRSLANGAMPPGPAQ